MKVGLIDVDSHNFPNLALMKISSYEKAQGNEVEWWNGLFHYDRVYQAKVFDSTYSPDMKFCVNADEIIKGGTGYDLGGGTTRRDRTFLPRLLHLRNRESSIRFLDKRMPKTLSLLYRWR